MALTSPFDPGLGAIISREPGAGSREPGAAAAICGAQQGTACPATASCNGGADAMSRVMCALRERLIRLNPAPCRPSGPVSGLTRLLCLTAVLLLSAVTLTAPAAAQDDRVLVSNYDQGNRSTSSYRADNYRFAQKFHTGDNPEGYLVTSVRRRMNTHRAGMRVSIREGGGTNPGGTVLYDFGTIEGLNPTITAPAGAVLEPDTDYFLVLIGVASGDGQRVYETTPNDAEDSDGLNDWNIADECRRYVSVTWGNCLPLRNSLSIEINGIVLQTIPEPLGAQVRGDKLVIRFSEPLAAAANLSNDAFKVTKGSSDAAVDLSSSIAPVISGDTVTLTLATAAVRTDRDFKVDYAAPASGSDNLLKDTYDNEVADFDDLAVTNLPASTAAPTASDGTVTATEDVAYTFQAPDFNFSDTDTHDALESVLIESLPGSDKGVLKLNDTLIVANNLGLRVSKAQLDAGELTYEPPADESGDDYTTFTFKVSDGASDSTSSYTMTIDVDTVPDVTQVAVTSTPNSGNSYGLAENIRVTVTFDEAVTVTGDPVFEIRVGGPAPAVTKNALYVSGSGTTALVFEYTVVADDRDNNGIWIEANALKLNGGTIRDSDNNNADITHARLGTQSGHRVDPTPPNTPPTVTGTPVVTTDEDTEYTFRSGDFNFSDADAGDTLDLVEIVSLPGSGKGTLKIEGKAFDVPETFYPGELDTDGLLTYEPPDDANGDDFATFTFRVNDGDDDSADATMTINVDSVPDVTDVAVTSTPTSGTTPKKYGAGEKIRITATFDEDVTVTGDPVINVEVGSNSRPAAYVSGTGTTELVFEYTVVAGDSDTDGISISADALGLNSGTIKDSDSHDADITHTALAAQSTHQVDGTLTPPDNAAPTVTGAEVTSDAPKSLVITFDEALDTSSVPAASAFTVKVDGTAEGTPTNVSISGAVVTLTLATALDGGQSSVTVDYTNPGTANSPLKDAANNEVATFTGQSVTNNAPACPDTASFPADALWTACLTVGVSSSGNDFGLVGDGSGEGALSPASFTHEGTEYTIDGIVESGTTLSISFDRALPDASNAWAFRGLLDSASLYIRGNAGHDTTTHTYTWNTPRDLWAAANVGDKVSVVLVLDHLPWVSDSTVDMDEDTPYVFQASDFPYTHTGGDFPLESVEIESLPTNGQLKLNGTVLTMSDVEFGYSVTRAQLDANQLTYEPPDDANGTGYAMFDFYVRVNGQAGFKFVGDVFSFATMTINVDSVPDVTGVAVTSEPTSGTTPKKYGAGEKIRITATFDEDVTVTGNPVINVEVGSNSRPAAYVSGSAAMELVFEYTVVAEDSDTDGISINANALGLNSGTIKDSDSHDADITHAALATQSDHQVDGTLTPPSTNTAPTAEAGSDQSVASGTVVTLDGSGSTDDDGTIATYAWARTGGSGSASVTLSDAAVAGPTFTADTLTSNDGAVTHIFTLTVTDDDGATASDTVTITVTPPDNAAPTAEAGSDQSVASGSVVTLDGSGTDSDGSIATYAWTRTGGTSSASVTLSDAAVAGPSFTADTLTSNDGAVTHIFTLTVTDDDGATASDTVTITVTPPDNAAPTASNRSVTTGENVAHTFAAAEFGFFDTDSGDTLASVKIETLPDQNHGALTLSNAAVTANRVIDVADIGNLVFTPAANWTGAATFTFKVNDGTADSTDTYTMTINVAPVPKVTQVAVTSTPGAAADTYGGGEVIQVTVTFDEAVTVTGTPFFRLRMGNSGGAPISDEDATYVSGSGTTALVFGYTVLAADRDNNGIWIPADALMLNGGTIQSTANNSIAAILNHTRLGTQGSHKVDGSLDSNAAPTSTGGSVTVDEDDNEFKFAAENFNFSDGDNDPLHSVKIVTLPANGKLQEGILVLSAGDSVAAANIGNLGFIPDPNWNGETSFTFRVNDGTVDSADATMTITVIPAPDVLAITNDETSGVRVTSTPRTFDDGGGKVYGATEEIQVTVTFDQAVIVTGTPQFELSFGSGRQRANYVSGSGTTALVFEYTVQSEDSDSNGISIPRNAVKAIEGSMIQSAANSPRRTNAYFAIFSRAPGTQSAHKVNGSLTPDETAPTVSSAVVAETAPKVLAITFDEPLATGSVPAASAFTVKVDGIDEPEPAAVEISGMVVNLTLATALDDSQTNVTVDYTNPGTDNSPLKDPSDNEVATFTNRAVDNQAPACPTGQPGNALWTACLTVQGDPEYGYAVNQYGVLTPAVFIFDGNNKQVTVNAVRKTTSGADSVFELGLTTEDPSVAAYWILQVGGTTLNFAEATQPSTNLFRWSLPADLDWTNANFGDKVSVSLTQGNRPPTSADKTVETDEDVAYTFAATDFAFDDDDADDNALVSVKIVSLLGDPGNTGTLSHDGTAIDDQNNLPVMVSKSDLESGLLTYTPPADANGTGYTGFTFRVNDGEDDSADATMTINVDSVPDVTQVAVTSEPNVDTDDPKDGTVDTYGLGEKIRITATFDEAVTVTGDPVVNVEVGSNSRPAAYVSGTGTMELVFEYTVVAADSDSDGIEIAANALGLNSGTIKDSDSHDADITHDALAAQGGHKVDGSLVLPGKPTAVTVAAVDGESTQLGVSWTAPSEPATDYDYRYRKKDTDPVSDWTTVDNTTITATTVTITGLEAFTAYEAQVRAVNAVGAGDWSDVQSGMTRRAVFLRLVPEVGDIHLQRPAGHVKGTFTVYVSTNPDLSEPPAIAAFTVKDDDDADRGTVSNIRVTSNGRAGYLFDVTVEAGYEGPLNVAVVAGALPGGANIAVSLPLVVDQTRPTVAISTDVVEPINIARNPESGFDVEIDLSDDSVIGTGSQDPGEERHFFREDDISVTNGDWHGESYTIYDRNGDRGVDIRATADSDFEGVMEIAVAANKFTDRVTNPNIAGSLTLTVDTKRPRIESIEHLTPESSPTNADSLTWRVTFTEDVKGVDLNDFTVSGTTAPLNFSEVTASRVYDLTASGGDLDTLNDTVTLGLVSTPGISDTADNSLTDTEPKETDERAYVVDNTPPTVASATVNRTTLVITFNEALGAASDLANSAFGVKKTVSGTEQAVTLSGAPVILDDTVTLTLASRVFVSDTDVKVSYTVPGTDSNNQIKDVAGNAAGSVTDQAVTNNTANVSATGTPMISGEVIVGGTLTAGLGTIADDDGLPATFPDDYSFQWVRQDDTSGTNPVNLGTDPTYTLVGGDLGKYITVKVTFDDGGGTEETRSTVTTGAVQPKIERQFVLTESSYTVTEGENLTVIAQMQDSNGNPAALQTDLKFILETVSDTATAQDDYIVPDNVFTLSQGDTSIELQVRTVEDGLVEGE